MFENVPELFAKVKRRVKHATKPKRIMFTVGFWRSGTTLVMDVFGRSEEVRAFQESSKLAYNQFRRIRSDDDLKGIINQVREPWIVFKPLNDSHRIQELMQVHDNTKAVWIYRNYLDVINSAEKKWPGRMKSIIEALINDDLSRDIDHAIADGISDESLAIATKCCQNGISNEDGAALIWYVRNRFYFEAGLQHNPDVLVCRYEDLVTDPAYHFRRVFDFFECPFSPAYVNQVHTSSLQKNPPPTLQPEIESLCRDLLERFDQLRS